MRLKNIIQKLLLSVVMTSAAIFTVSCEDEPDKYEIAGGTPEIIYIRTVSNPDSLITAAYTGSIIAICGNNLRSVVELYFNDQKATLNTSYMTDHTIIVDVPSALPNNPTDKIYMVNKDGVTTSYDFSVTIPAPTLSNMLCEIVKPGEVATINGDYLLDYEDYPMVIEMPDGQTITDFTKQSQYSVSFVVPEGCTKSGAITVTTKYGSTVSSLFNFNDKRGLLFDFDGETGLGNHGWHNAVIASDENSIDGNYMQLGDGSSTMDDATWNDSQFAFEYWPGNWEDPETYTAVDGIRLTDLVDFTDYSNMAFKFELCVPSSNSWSAGALQVIPAGVEYVSYGSAQTDAYGNAAAGCNNTYVSGDECPRALYRPWVSDGSYDTGDKWVTVTLPIGTDFKYGYSGDAATGSLNSESFTSLVFFLCGGGVSGTECTPVLKIDNIRAVPYK